MEHHLVSLTTPPYVHLHTPVILMYPRPLFYHKVQWNPSIAATLGEQHSGRYIGVACIEGLFCTQTVCLGPECLAVISQLP